MVLSERQISEFSIPFFVITVVWNIVLVTQFLIPQAGTLVHDWRCLYLTQRPLQLSRNIATYNKTVINSYHIFIWLIQKFKLGRLLLYTAHLVLLSWKYYNCLTTVMSSQIWHDTVSTFQERITLHYQHLLSHSEWKPVWNPNKLCS